MPFIEVKMWKGRSPEKRKELVRNLTRTTAETIDCPPRAVQVVIDEYEKENWGIAGKPADELSQE